MKQNIITLYKYQNWQPVMHTVFKDSDLAAQIHEKGFVVLPLFNAGQIEALRTLYKSEHKIKTVTGGMFYSLYSKDHGYRKRIHESIAKILEPTLQQHFTGYKNIVNIFINKISGPESGFYTHQDTTALDEFKHSPLSIWIPLQDITPQNGALGVIEKSHWFFSPYRGVSFPFPFSKINETVKKYLKPIYLKAGEAIVFDSRLVHNSFANTSGTDRIVALCGIFPKDAKFITCFKEKNNVGKIELIEQDDSYILENDNFYYDCHSRPANGKVIGRVEEEFPEMSADTFEKLCQLNNIAVQELETESDKHCVFIAEPDGENKF